MGISRSCRRAVDSSSRPFTDEPLTPTPQAHQLAPGIHPTNPIDAAAHVPRQTRQRDTRLTFCSRRVRPRGVDEGPRLRGRGGPPCSATTAPSRRRPGHIPNTHGDGKGKRTMASSCSDGTVLTLKQRGTVQYPLKLLWRHVRSHPAVRD